ncbi:LysR family transcriptional regulator [Lactiplantibacillus plantarum]|uniref:LysR family transcriptional regulator n=1 Tax=Lactiplantibacillus plantarum TaxID=1590 RepID=UPI00404668BC
MQALVAAPQAHRIEFFLVAPLHQLQIFERVLARRSLSRAASEMHLTQPTVTKAIHDLEAFFGATLFERSNRGVTPTELALVLGRRVHAMMAEIRYMADDIDAVLGGLMRSRSLVSPKHAVSRRSAKVSSTGLARSLRTLLAELPERFCSNSASRTAPSKWAESSSASLIHGVLALLVASSSSVTSSVRLTGY